MRPIFAQHSGNRSDDDLSRCEHANLGAGHSVSLKRSAHLIRHQTGLRNLDFKASSWVCTVSALTARQVRTSRQAIVSISRAIPAPPRESDPTTTSRCGSRPSAIVLSFDPFSRARFWGVAQRKVGDLGCAFRASLEKRLRAGQVEAADGDQWDRRDLVLPLADPLEPLRRPFIFLRLVG